MIKMSNYKIFEHDDDFCLRINYLKEDKKLPEIKTEDLESIR